MLYPGLHTVPPSPFVREFSFDLSCQLGIAGQRIFFFLSLIPADFRALLSGAKEAEVLSQKKRGNWGNGVFTRSIWFVNSVEESGNIHIHTGPHQLSASPWLEVLQSRLQSASDARLCLPSKWKSIETSSN